MSAVIDRVKEAVEKRQRADGPGVFILRWLLASRRNLMIVGVATIGAVMALSIGSSIGYAAWWRLNYDETTLTDAAAATTTAPAPTPSVQYAWPKQQAPSEPAELPTWGTADTDDTAPTTSGPFYQREDAPTVTVKPGKKQERPATAGDAPLDEDEEKPATVDEQATATATMFASILLNKDQTTAERDQYLTAMATSMALGDVRSTDPADLPAARPEGEARVVSHEGGAATVEVPLSNGDTLTVDLIGGDEAWWRVDGFELED